MLIDSFNINSLRVFERVYQLKSMTLAAKELGMTQSGVSQHIKNLETSLDQNLFDRLKHKLIATRQADDLAKSCHRHLLALERSLQQITGKSETYRGEVHIGLPLEFGNNFILPYLTEIGRMHPEISFHIKYGHASEMNGLLLAGDLDFCFVDSFALDSQIELNAVWDETLMMCISKEYKRHLFGDINPPHEITTYDRLDYVDYVEGAPVLAMWFKHHLKKPFIPNVRANLMDVQGMSRIIREGLGAGILPLHVVNRINKQYGNILEVFNGKKTPLKNTISLGQVKQRTLSPSAKYCLKYCQNKLAYSS